MEQIKFQEYLITLCRKNMKAYVKISDALVSSLVMDSDHCRSVNQEAVLDLAHALKAFVPVIPQNVVTMDLKRSKAHAICKQSTIHPELIDKIFGQPGVMEKAQPK